MQTELIGLVYSTLISPEGGTDSQKEEAGSWVPGATLWTRLSSLYSGSLLTTDRTRAWAWSGALLPRSSVCCPVLSQTRGSLRACC